MIAYRYSYISSYCPVIVTLFCVFNLLGVAVEKRGRRGEGKEESIKSRSEGKQRWSEKEGGTEGKKEGESEGEREGGREREGRREGGRNNKGRRES